MTSFSKKGAMVPSFAGNEIVFKNTPNGPDTIGPVYFLPLFVGAAVIRNTNFINADFFDPAYLGSYLWFETKSFFSDPDLPEYVCSEQFIAGFHIGQVDLCKQVGQKCQEFISKRMKVK
jgi:hypothetical protein